MKEKDTSLTIEQLLQVQQLHQHAEQLYRQLVENQPDLICRFLPDTTLTFVNAAYADFFQRQPADLIGKRFIDFLGEEERQKILAHLQFFGPAKPADFYEHRTLRADGAFRWHLWHDFAIFDKAGKVKEFQSVGVDITERKQAETALRESEMRYQRLVERLPDIVYTYSPRQGASYWSPSVEKILGISSERLRHNPFLWHDAIHPDDLPKVNKAITQFTQGKHFELEYRIKDVLGQWHWVYDRSLGGKKVGKETHIEGIATDITQRKQTEEALCQAHNRLIEAIEAFPDGFAIYDSNDRLVLCNTQYRSIYAQSAPAIVPGATFEDMLRYGLARGQYAEAVGREEEWIKERLVQHREPKGAIEQKLGDGRWLLIRECRTADGETVGARTDITNLKQVEEALFAEKERAQVTLHSIGDAVITTDAEGIIDYMNPMAEELTGWTLKEVKGKPLGSIFIVIEEQSREPILDPVARCLQEGQVIGLANHSVLIDRGGRERAIEDSAAPIRHRDGKMLGVVLVFRDVSERRRMVNQMTYDATHDDLTGLINRREFENRLEHALTSVHKYGKCHALCYLDLDQFKIVNDTAGHAAGDELLRQIKGLWGTVFRERDTFARLGGDEFGLLLENCPLEKAYEIAQTLITIIRDYRFSWAEYTFQIGVSIGLVPITEEAKGKDQLLTQADIACYTAKELGRNRIHVYQREDSELVQRYNDLLRAASLREALEQDRFCLYCQPILSLSVANGMPKRYEMLLRMLDRDNNLIMPGVFIPAAERYGLMSAIDRWVIKAAFRCYTEKFSNTSDMVIAINLSGNSLSEESLLEFVFQQFKEFSMAPEKVCFEITETAAIHNLNRAATFMAEVKKCGSSLALDDFGSGLSSFNYLKNLPVDYLKIDGGFVRDMHENHIDCSMVSAINQMGHIMGIQTIAEYAHNAAVIARLRELGVDYAQGYGVSPPLGLDELRVSC